MERTEDCLNEIDRKVVDAVAGKLEKDGIGSALLRFFLHESHGPFNPYDFYEWYPKAVASMDVMLVDGEMIESMRDDFLSKGESLKCRRTDDGRIDFLYCMGKDGERIGRAYVMYGKS